MSKIKGITLSIYIVCAAFILGAVYIHEFLIDAIEHNMAINLSISTLLIGSILFTLYSVVRLNRQYKLWHHIEKQNQFNDTKKLNRIFGKRFSLLINAQGDKQEELVQAWTEFSDWKARILDYLSGTLIGLGLLGTFIGLMHTMGSISDVLSAASGNDMVKAIAVPLSSMSGAFSASLMGLLSSLFVGLLGMLIDRLNSEFVEIVKTSIYNRNQLTQADKVVDEWFIGDQNPLSHQMIKDGMAKMDRFCQQAEHFMLGMDNKIEAFKSQVAEAFDVLSSEVIKLNTLTHSVNQLSDAVVESNQQIRHEILSSKETLLELNKLSFSLSEEVKNEILLNRQQVVELNTQAVAERNKIEKNVLLNRNEILQLTSLSTAITQKIDRNKESIEARILSILNCEHQNASLIKEVGSAVDTLSETGRYNKKNIDRILTMQAICHDIGLLSMDEVVKTTGYLETLLAENSVQQPEDLTGSRGIS